MNWKISRIEHALLATRIILLLMMYTVTMFGWNTLAKEPLALGFVLGIAAYLNISLLTELCIKISILLWSGRMGPSDIDPEDPPRYVTVVRGADDPETTCTCHEAPLTDGDVVLHWPQPAQVLCEKTHGHKVAS